MTVITYLFIIDTNNFYSIFESDFHCRSAGKSNQIKYLHRRLDDPTEIRHIDELLKLLQVMTGDERYQMIFNRKKGVHSMCDVAERLEKMGIEKGLKQGIGEGIKQGIELGKTAGIHAEKVRVYKRLIEKGFSEKEAREIAELPETLNV